ncbi:hypothetical protein ACFWB2_32785 [Streptomyces virginiae]|uniref:hypothetical protein n=1 Tax=Streptomyces virginiae TaxID=1961 RepID=UPI002255D12A|nr:hypothetical protein [Streptomyces virginiae]MCX4716392.1 hypothetical protein [Streptomyces virginiae]MCX5274168.1 hypothetical protein [Streptomyces virginiae]WSC80203.1 hypothetical protein OHA56_29945 [Streptomyces virginiae]
MRFRVRVPVATRVAFVAVTVVAGTSMLGGCSQSPADRLEEWYSSGGEAQIKKLNEDAGRVNEVSMRTIDVQGPACQDLLAQTAKAEKLDPIPDEAAQRYWKEALGGFRRGAGECADGAAKKEEIQVSRGIRVVQTEGLPKLVSTVSMIKAGLAAAK